MKNKSIYSLIIKALRQLSTSFYLCILCFTLMMCYNANAQVETEVMVLGTYHLNQINEFNPNILNQLISRLENYNFDAICIENMPTQLLYDIQSRQDSAYAEVVERWGGERLTLAKLTQEYLDIGVLEAQNEINRTFSKKYLGQNNREKLIQYFIASGDIASALLQYKYISENRNINTSTFYKKIINKLEEISESPNEIYSLSVSLAKKTALQKIEYIDDFQDEAMLLKYFPEFISDYKNYLELFKDVRNRPIFQKVDSLKTLCIKNNNLLPLYIFMNSKEYQKQDYDAQWKIWLNTNFPSGSDRARYALWEMRNLQISANIMKTAAFYPGKKILVIIGASHKSFIEKYLQQANNIRLLDFN